MSQIASSMTLEGKTCARHPANPTAAGSLERTWSSHEKVLLTALAVRADAILLQSPPHNPRPLNMGIDSRRASKSCAATVPHTLWPPSLSQPGPTTALILVTVAGPKDPWGGVDVAWGPECV